LKSLSLLLAIASTLAAAPQPSPKFFPYNYRQDDLPNGLRLITVPTDYPHVIAVYIVVETGSRNEVEPGHTGFAHLFEHLMFRGTEKYPTDRYQAAMARMGAFSNAFTTPDYTCFQTIFSKEDLETVLEMEADRFQHLKYSEADFKTETLAVLGEYNKNSANPASKLAEVLSDTAFLKHTYKHTTMGFLKDIQDMPNQYEYSLRFFDHYYRPEYTTIIVTGDVKPKAVREIVEKYWGTWKRGNYQVEIPMEAAQEEPRVGRVSWPEATLPLLSIAYKVPAYTDGAKDTASLEAIALFAFSPISDLYQKLVIQEHKADQLSATNPMRVDPSLFEIRARINSPADVASVQAEILSTVTALRERPIDPSLLTAVRKHLQYSLTAQLDTSDAVAGMLASFIALRRTPDTIDRFYTQLSQLTPDDIQQTARKYLTDNARTIVTLQGPESGQ
jgi:zinc protease